MMQEKVVVDKIKQSYRNVDIIFGTHNIFKLAELLSLKLLDRPESKKMIIDIWDVIKRILSNPSIFSTLSNNCAKLTGCSNVFP